MPSTLLMRLEGPIQKWGNNLGGFTPSESSSATASGFGLRATQLVPNKSGVLGLVAAALGLDRAEPLDHLAALQFGVRVDRAGVPYKDFQTAHLFQDLPVAHPKQQTALVYHGVLHDASFVVGLEGQAALLNAIYVALQNPHWPLCLGRKAYLPSVPVFQHGPPVPYALAEALSRAEFASEQMNSRLDEYPRYFVEVQAIPDEAEGIVEFGGWDEPDRPFGERHYRKVQAATYVGLWGEVLGCARGGVCQPIPTRKAHTERQQRIDQVATRSVLGDLKTEWTPEECKREGLPLYRSKQWFEAEFARLGSLAAMEAEYPKYSNQRLSEWAQRHGIEVKPRISEATWAQVDKLLAEGQSPGRIAQTLAISKPSVQRRAQKARGLVEKASEGEAL